ncbi:MAG: 4Fe-4S dicluster domain-containing protein [Candidatus Aminicenantes bacterium]|nr:4Fe-4S dicluster domain-containing protein [Candidatus Aminicenantes bacterium]
MSEVKSPDSGSGYKKALIYFLSGTGNSYRVGCWMQEICSQKGLEPEIIPIDTAKPGQEIESSPDNLVILAYPTHGFLPPWSAIKFLFKLPRKRRAHIYCTPTRGCFYLWKIFIPGAAGLASFLPALILPLKGYSFRGVVSIDMPANMISIHSRLSDKNIDRIKSKARKKTDANLKRVLSGKRVWFTLNNLYEAVWCAVLLRFWPLFPILYLLIGRFFMGKMMFANSSCISCGLCVRSCPNGAVIMKGRKRPRPYWRYNCEDCLRCMNYCPQKAIEVGHSWGVALYFIAMFPLSVTLFDLAARYLPVLKSARTYSTVEILNAAYYYPVIIIAYFIFFQLIRWKPFNLIFTWTTFTHIFRRYHDPETKISDLSHKEP